MFRYFNIRKLKIRKPRSFYIRSFDFLIPPKKFQFQKFHEKFTNNTIIYSFSIIKNLENKKNLILPFGKSIFHNL